MKDRRENILLADEFFFYTEMKIDKTEWVGNNENNERFFLFLLIMFNEF